ncbi:hypothetical protein ACFFKU_07815 [Kineococcus gynurae]|uniref:Uncharacterized protein n=1 Tax=Kineococcus gynurae TaxID=452979 RepID=A0ABV5LWI5_9ACTN
MRRATDALGLTRDPDAPPPTPGTWPERAVAFVAVLLLAGLVALGARALGWVDRGSAVVPAVVLTVGCCLQPTAERRGFRLRRRLRRR